MIPSEALIFIECMGIAVVGEEGVDEGGAIHGECLFVRLCHQVTAHVAIRVAHAPPVAVPCHGSLRKEEVFAFVNAAGHLLQIIGSNEIVGGEHLGL